MDATQGNSCGLGGKEGGREEGRVGGVFLSPKERVSSSPEGSSWTPLKATAAPWWYVLALPPSPSPPLPPSPSPLSLSLPPPPPLPLS